MVDLSAEKQIFTGPAEVKLKNQKIEFQILILPRLGRPYRADPPVRSCLETIFVLAQVVTS